MPVKTILVAVDGSRHSMNAVDAAAELAQHHGAALILLHVVAHPQSLADAPGLTAYERVEHVRLTADEMLRAEGQQVLDDAEKRAHNRGATQVLGLVELGDPARRILEVADARGVDLIVLGRRGLGALAGLLLGSVSHKVLQLAKRPCLTID
jgi:nucleotide-binding universal stress UspA family protein